MWSLSATSKEARSRSAISKGAGSRSAISRKAGSRSATTAGWRNAALSLAILAALGGCQVRPLYLDQATGGPLSPVPDLRAILIDQPSTRIDQVLRNELLFLFRGDGSEVIDPRYRLRIILTSSTDNVAVDYVEDLPSAVIVVLNATFVLSEIGTDDTLLTGSAVATASYDFSSQRFANERAERNAETRAAESLAEQLNARIASYFAARRSS